MKKIILLIVALSLVLTGCGGNNGSSQISDTPHFFQYQTAEFKINVPDAWLVQTAFTSEYSENIRVAFIDNIKENDFTPNVTILREDNEKQFSNFDYSQEKLFTHSNTLLNYRLDKQEEATFPVGKSDTNAYIIYFSGKDDTESTTLNFIQVSIVKGNKAYTATATYLPSESDQTVSKMDEMIRSFQLK